MRLPNTTTILPETPLLAAGGLFLAAAWFLVDPWTWEWCVFVGLATLALLLGTISVFEKWTEARGYWD